MKKQLLLLFMALFALGASQTYAQEPYLPPTEINEICVDLDNPLTPVPGKPYTYEVNVPNPAGTKTYHWFVTQDETFISLVAGVPTLTAEAAREIADGTGTILASGSSWYNSPTNVEDNISLTWQSFSLAADEYVFVVIYVENTAIDGCVSDNLKVYRIQPLHAFTLTVANIDGNAIDDTMTEICVDDVQSAVFDPTADDGNGGVVYDYGQNEFYFAVAAANFSGDFRLAASFNGLQAATAAGNVNQVATIYWNTTFADVQAAAAGGVEIIADNSETVLGTISPPAGASYGEGQTAAAADAAFMIYIKVVVEHNQFEAANAAGYQYTLALDAVLPQADGITFGPHDNTNPLGDLDNLATVLADCGRNAFGVHNQATQLLLPRPTVESVPAGLLLPNAP